MLPQTVQRGNQYEFELIVWYYNATAQNPPRFHDNSYRRSYHRKTRPPTMLRNINRFVQTLIINLQLSHLVVNQHYGVASTGLAASRLDLP